MSGNGYLIKPVYKALKVLECLGAEGRELSLTEVSHLTGLPKTTAFKYLYTLKKRGFVTHSEETERYGIGLRVWEIGRLASDSLCVREIALPYMRELRDRFNETINLGILDGTQVVYVEMVESRHSLRMRAQLGGRDPAYSTALGKAMLAFLPEEKRREHLPSRLVPRTPKTHTSLKTLNEDLKRTRIRGYARDDGENEEDARCVGAPIFDHSGAVIAAISLSAPATRIDEQREQEVVAAAVRTASEISQRLGYRHPDLPANPRHQASVSQQEKPDE